LRPAASEQEKAGQKPGAPAQKADHAQPTLKLPRHDDFQGENPISQAFPCQVTGRPVANWAAEKTSIFPAMQPQLVS